MPEEVSGPTCPRCGELNPAGARFCHRCGHNLAGPPPGTIAASPPAGKKVCAACRTLNEPTATYCYKCGVKLPDQVLTTAEAIGNPAGFWVRVLASVIDNILIYAITVLIFVLRTGIKLEVAITGEGLSEVQTWVLTFLELGLGITYSTFAIGRWGKTIGKAILGLKVTRNDGSRLTYWRSFGRYWAYYLSLIPLGLGFIWIALTSHKRGWHDHICDTRVIKTRG